MSDEELDTMDALWQKAIDLYDRKMASHTDKPFKAVNYSLPKNQVQTKR